MRRWHTEHDLIASRCYECSATSKTIEKFSWYILARPVRVLFGKDSAANMQRGGQAYMWMKTSARFWTGLIRHLTQKKLQKFWFSVTLLWNDAAFPLNFCTSSPCDKCLWLEKGMFTKSFKTYEWKGDWAVRGTRQTIQLRSFFSLFFKISVWKSPLWTANTA